MGIEDLIEKVRDENELIQSSAGEFKDFHRRFSNSNFKLFEDENILSYEPVLLEAAYLRDNYSSFNVKSLPIIKEMVSYFDEKVSYFKKEFYDELNNNLDKYKCLDKKDLDNTRLRSVVKDLLFLDSSSDELGIKIRFRNHKFKKVRLLSEKIVSIDEENYLSNIKKIEEFNSEIKFNIDNFDKLNTYLILDMDYDSGLFDKYSNNPLLTNNVEQYKKLVSEVNFSVENYKVGIRENIDLVLKNSSAIISNIPKNFGSISNYLSDLSDLSIEIVKTNSEYSSFDYKKEDRRILNKKIERTVLDFERDVETFGDLESSIKQLKKIDESNYEADKERINGLLSKDYKINNSSLRKEFDQVLENYIDEISRIKTFVYEGQKREDEIVLSQKRLEDELEDLRNKEKESILSTNERFEFFNGEISQEKVYFDLMAPIQNMKHTDDYITFKVRNILLGKEGDTNWEDRFKKVDERLARENYVESPRSIIYLSNLQEMINESSSNGYIQSMVDNFGFDKKIIFDINDSFERIIKNSTKLQDSYSKDSNFSV